MKQHYLTIIFIFLFFSCQKEIEEYVCTPCNLPCDNLIFKEGGSCPHCKMDLIKKSELIDESSLILNEVELSTGSGVFVIEGAKGKEEKSIKVYYHKPKNYSKDSRILMVIPGAGRNGDSYRDTWKEAAEKYKVLILSPKFSENHYLFEDYHLCGLIKESNLRKSIEYSDSSNIVRLNENNFTYQLNTNSNEWLFNDFDRIFDLVVEASGSSQTKYDLFGHSAGGQILHRLILFSEKTKADRIIASNSGFYTLPDFEVKMPFGIESTGLSIEELNSSFSKKLILLIGQLDNENERRGILLRSNTVDKQGIHRLSRGQYFYEFCKNQADEFDAEFNWILEIVPDVGHNQKRMGNAAAKVLYE